MDDLPSKADMFWNILSSSGVIAGLFSKVTNLSRERETESQVMTPDDGKKRVIKLININIPS